MDVKLDDVSAHELSIGTGAGMYGTFVFLTRQNLYGGWPAQEDDCGDAASKMAQVIARRQLSRPRWSLGSVS